MQKGADHRPDGGPVLVPKPLLHFGRLPDPGLDFGKHALARPEIVLMGDVKRAELAKLLLGIADHLLKRGIGGHITLLSVAEHDPDRKLLEHRPPAQLAGAQRPLGALALGNIAHETAEKPRLPRPDTGLSTTRRGIHCRPGGLP